MTDSSSSVRKMKTITIGSLSGGLLLFLVFVLWLSAAIGNIRQVDVAEAHEDAHLKWSVEKIKIGADIEISGWAFYPGESNKIYDIHLVLKDLETGRFYQLPTKMVIRKDINKKDPSRNDHSASGFLSRAKVKQLNEPLSRYRLYIQYYSDHKKILVNTDRSLADTKRGQEH